MRADRSVLEQKRPNRKQIATAIHFNTFKNPSGRSNRSLLFFLCTLFMVLMTSLIL
jgi:hypothetical protein